MQNLGFFLHSIMLCSLTVSTYALTTFQAAFYSGISEEQMYAEMREKAGEMGANAIILDSVTEPTTGSKVASVLLGTAANRQGKAVAVYVFPAEAVAAPAR